MEDFLIALRLLLEAITAVLALGAAVESRRTRRKCKRIEIELQLNPEKSADAIQKRANGSSIIIEGVHIESKEHKGE